MVRPRLSWLNHRWARQYRLRLFVAWKLDGRWGGAQHWCRQQGLGQPLLHSRSYHLLVRRGRDHWQLSIPAYAWVALDRKNHILLRSPAGTAPHRGSTESFLAPPTARGAEGSKRNRWGRVRLSKFLPAPRRAGAALDPERLRVLFLCLGSNADRCCRFDHYIMENPGAPFPKQCGLPDSYSKSSRPSASVFAQYRCS